MPGFFVGIIIIFEDQSMQPYQNYTYPYHLNHMYNWFNPYFHQNPQYMDYLNSRYYTQPQVQKFFPKQMKKIYKSNQEVIKIEEDSPSYKNEQKNISQVQIIKKSKSPKKKKTIAKLIKGQQNPYIHPRKQVKNRVKYFDPNSAPPVTTASYNLVNDTTKQDERNYKLQQIQEENVNQLEYPEQFQHVFITFRYRRIKKKFKKYITDKDESYCAQKLDNSDSDNEQDCSSQFQIQQIDKQQIKKTVNSIKAVKGQQVRKSTRNYPKHKKISKSIQSISQSKQDNEL